MEPVIGNEIQKLLKVSKRSKRPSQCSSMGSSRAQQKRGKDLGKLLQDTLSPEKHIKKVVREYNELKQTEKSIDVSISLKPCSHTGTFLQEVASADTGN